MNSSALQGKNLPIGAFGAVMGLAGLGLTSRTAAPLFPGVFRAPAYFTESWVALAVLVFLGLLFLYLLKIIFHKDAVKAEFSNLASIGFCGTLPVSMALVAGGLTPYLPALADGLWWLSVIVFFAFFAWGVYRIVLASPGIADIYPVWLVLFVGGIVLPGPGLGLGHAGAARIVFSISALAGLFLFCLLLYRAFRAPPLPERLRPTWFILLVPPSLIGAYGAGLFGAPALEYLYFVALAVLAGLLVYAPRLRHWGFSPVWWSITFPLDAFAYAAARFAQNNPLPAWKALAGIALALATLAVGAILLRSIYALLRRTA